MLFIKLISYFLNFLPRALLLGIGDAIGLLWFYGVPFRRGIVLENLTRVFGSEKSEKDIWKMARRNFQHYGRTFMEILCSVTWNEEDFVCRIKVEGWENIKPIIDRGQGCFLLTAHLGNWETLIGSGIANGVPADVVVKSAKIQFLQNWIEKYRRRMGCGLISHTESVGDILNSLNRGRVVPFIFDQFMGPPIGLPLLFFGHEAGTMASLALFLERREFPVVPVYSYRDGDGHLHTVFEPPIHYASTASDRSSRLYEVSQKFNFCIENMIRKHPTQWLWLHRRWKPFQGESRWVKKALALASVLLTLLLSSCSSQSVLDQASDEGEKLESKMPLPPEQEVAKVPEFTPTNPGEDPAMSKSRSVFVDPPAKPSPKSTKTESKISEPPKTELLKFQSVTQSPFEIGEVQTLRLRWLAIPAGEATMEVKKGEVWKGRETWKLRGNVRSNRVVDLIYRLNNTVESWIDKQGFIPYKFVLNMDEKDQQKLTRVVYDHLGRVAHYDANRVSQRWGDKKEQRDDALEPGAQDLWSALYYVRTLEFALNKTQSFYIYENGKNFKVELTPESNELVQSGVGAFQCWKIRVQLKLENVLQPMGAVYMWLSDDSKKYLVRFDAKIKIGNLYGDLVGLKEGL